MAESACTHIDGIEKVLQPKDLVCEECEKIGGRWVHLRTCQTCGVTLCCDSSPNQHMTHHHHESGHPVVASAQPGEKWLYCYVDELMVSYR